MQILAYATVAYILIALVAMGQIAAWHLRDDEPLNIGVVIVVGALWPWPAAIVIAAYLRAPQPEES